MCNIQHTHKVLSSVRRKGAEQEQQPAEDPEIPVLITFHLNPLKNLSSCKICK